MGTPASAQSHLTDEEREQLAKCAETRDGTFTLTLKRPVQVGATTYTELRFRAMTGRDLRKMPVGEGQATIGHFLDMASGMMTEPAAVIDVLSPIDAMRVTELASFFVQRSSEATG